MLAEMIAKIKNNVVVIKNPRGGLGTGIVLDNKSIIVTNSHVVQGARTIGIITNDDKRYVGRVIDADLKVDYAFVFCEQLKLSEFPILADRTDLMEGEDVVAIGHPHGYDFTVSKGIVSSAHREINSVEYIQTDVPINPGNSGGPLFDTQGRILGINTWIVSNAQGLSFAVPSNYLLDAYNNLPPLEQVRAGYYCPACGKLNSKKGKYCESCGDDFQEESLPDFILAGTGCCKNCKKQNSPDEKYCSSCGALLIPVEDQKAKKKEPAAQAASDEVVICKSCGKENKGRKYCQNCGSQLS